VGAVLVAVAGVRCLACAHDYFLLVVWVRVRPADRPPLPAPQRRSAFVATCSEPPPFQRHERRYFITQGNSRILAPACKVPALEPGTESGRLESSARGEPAAGGEPLPLVATRAPDAKRLQ